MLYYHYQLRNGYQSVQWKVFFNNIEERLSQRTFRLGTMRKKTDWGLAHWYHKCGLVDLFKYRKIQHVYIQMYFIISVICVSVHKSVILW